MAQVISLELNEVNFEFVQFYTSRGELPAFAGVIARHGLVETESEKAYPHLEPWIQWPTFYTGKTFGEHKIFRLGDAVTAQHVQIWEYLERHGLTVGAVSPMNASNRCARPAFFLPDPWTQTTISASDDLRRLYLLLKRLVHDNTVDSRPCWAIAAELLPLAAPFMSSRSLAEYVRLIWASKSHRWARAAGLDRFLADIFTKLVRLTPVDYASLFLNAGAHIQHHHLYDAAVYTGELRNPAWYSSSADRRADPLLFIYRCYDAIIANLLKISGARLIISTALSQKPNTRLHHQYRLTEHESTLGLYDLPAFRFTKLMSRDFMPGFADEHAAVIAQGRLARIECEGRPLISVVNRGHALFCQVAHHGEPEALARCTWGERVLDLRDAVALVSIENGIHQTIGYQVDTGRTRADSERIGRIPLSSVFHHLCEAAGLAQARRPEAA